MDENTVDIASLKQHGFTDEELAPHIQQDTSTEQETSSETATDVNTEAEARETQQTPEPVETSPTEGDTSVKKHPNVVSYNRFKEINDKNKLLEAELAALKAQKPTELAPAPTQQPAQPQPQTNVPDDIAIRADREVREKLKIASTVDVDDMVWQMENPKEFRQYLKEIAKVEYRLETDERQRQQTYQENIKFVQELNAIPNFPVVFQFSLQELNELPYREASKISEAYGRINTGAGSASDFTTIREFAKQCQDKMIGITAAPFQGAVSVPATPAPAPTPTLLDKAAGLPRANNLSGAKTSAMSWTEVEKLAAAGEFDKIPADMLRQIDPKLLE